MELLITSVLFYVGLAILFVEAEPMILLKRFIGFKEEDMGSGPIYDFFCRLLYCSFCSGFWLTWIVSGDFNLAVITTFFVWIINKKI
jgi:hypothetical protein